MGVKLGNGKWAIKEDKLLAYNDNSGRFFNKEFDFSRGSSATYVAKDGLIKTAGLQETNLVNNGDFSELGSELVTNGNFDTDSDWTKGTGWSISSGKANCDGSQSGNANIYQSITFSVGKIYKVSFDVSNYVSGTVKIVFGDTGGTVRSANGNYVQYFTFASGSNFYIQGNSSFIGSVDNVLVKEVDPNDYWSLGTGWSIEDGLAKYTGTSNSSLRQFPVLTSGKTYKLKYEVISSSLNGDFKISGVTASAQNPLSQSVGTHSINFVADGSSPTSMDLRVVFNTTGTLEITNISVQEIQTDTPRIDFSDSVKGALLLEPSSTQLLQYSEDFSQWIKTSEVAITSNYGISPDGTKSSSRVLFSNASEILKLNFTATNDVIASIYIKGTEGETIRFGLQDGETNFTLTGDWQRINRYRSGGHTGGSENININTYGGVTARDIEVWGAMVEQKSFATSYIPNHGISGGVTRLADVCNSSGSAQDFNSEEGVLYLEAKVQSDTVFSPSCIGISDGTDANRISIIMYGVSDNIRSNMNVGGVTQFDINLSGYSREQYYKIAISYKENDCKMFINGVKVGTDTSVTMPSLGTFDRLNLDIGSNLYNFHGNVREVQVFTEALTDEQLQKLTTI